MTSRIQTAADIATGMAALRRLDPKLAALHDRLGDPPLRLRPAGLAGLVAVIVGQQVSVASARAILARTEAVFAPMTAANLAAGSEAQYRAAGLSAPKIRTLRALAAAVQSGLDLDGLADLTADEAHARLTAVTGIGPWTADVYLLFCLGAMDGFAAGDLALQEAAKQVFGLAERPSARALAEIAANWRPWRGVAARLLWAYYAHIKGWPEAAPVVTGKE